MCIRDRPKVKDRYRNLKVAREKDTVTYKGIPIRLSADFSNKKTLQAGRERIIPSHEGKETGTQINDLDQKEEINIQPEQNEETRIQKNEERLRNLRDNFKHSDIQIIGVPEGEEEDQEIENLFEKIMKNFPNLAKGIDFQKVQEAHGPKEVGPKEAHTKAHHN